MDDENTLAAMDTATDRDIELLLSVDPAPEFLARVRMRISAEPVAARPWRTLVAVAVSACLVAIALWVTFTGHHETSEISKMTRTPGAVVGPLQALQSSAVLQSVTKPTTDGEASTSKPAAAQPANDQLPEVLISASEAAAFEQFLADARERRFELSADSIARLTDTGPRTDLAIAPITIDVLRPIELLAPSEGVNVGLATGHAAQAPTPAPPSGAKPAPTNISDPHPSDWMARAEQGTPLKLQFVLSKYQGEKKISSIPYMVSVNANQGRPTSLRMGGNVPIPAAGSNGQLVYREFGTNIDVSVFSQTGQLFRVELTLEESSVYMGEKSLTPVTSTAPSFRSFKLTNNVVLKDGQTTQVTSAADPLTGDIVRIDLTLTVVK
jgi:hypothetical protein